MVSYDIDFLQNVTRYPSLVQCCGCVDSLAVLYENGITKAGGWPLRGTTAVSLHGYLFPPSVSLTLSTTLHFSRAPSLMIITYLFILRK